MLKIELIFLQWSNWFERFWCKVVKKLTKKIITRLIYCIGYVTIKKIGDYNNVNSVNPLYLIINEIIGHFEKKMKLSI